MPWAVLAVVLMVAVGVAAWGFPRIFSSLSPALEYHSPALAQESPQAPPPPKHISTPVPVRGIYMTSWVAGIPGWREKLVQFAKASEVNAMVIDVKDYSGKISFDTGDPVIKEMGAEELRIKDLPQFIAELHKNNIYAIARISSFQDPVLARHNPAVAIKRKNGSIWKDGKGLSWIDPGSHVVWEYLVRVAQAAERAGFDELNFDYVRYPTDGDLQSIAYNVPVGKDKSDVIQSYLAYLHEHLAYLPVPISVDLFGLTTIRTDDMGIGQMLEKVAPYVDYIAPMVYPSHYPDGYNGYANPALYPYEIINQAMVRASERLLAASSTPAKLRPWIQDFDLGSRYDAAMIRKEKQAIYDAGLDSWMAWDPKNIYTKGGYNTSTVNSLSGSTAQ